MQSSFLLTSPNSNKNGTYVGFHNIVTRLIMPAFLCTVHQCG